MLEFDELGEFSISQREWKIISELCRILEVSILKIMLSKIHIYIKIDFFKFYNF